MTAPSPVDILLVDDNPGKLLAVETALAPLGQNLVTATSGRDALRQMLSRPFATVILDVNMPGMDGFETAQLIRGRPKSAHTPIIFVSAISLADTDALRGYALGAVDYIFAPLIPEVLRAKVAVFVELHRKTEEAHRRALELEERTRQLEASQAQLRHAERLASLGTLSAGLGHDMGNLLLPIQARLETLDLGSLPADAREHLRTIGTCIGHLRRLASSLRLLALDPHEQSGKDESSDLEQWWPDAAPMLKHAVPRGVTLEWSVDSNPPQVMLARHLLSQAVFNLVQNAGDALVQRGNGCVRVWAKTSSDRKAIRLGVSDDGPGMTPEVQRRCFEPFFTTKTRGISTGLGLALVRGIVKRAGGLLELESVVGEGTTFSFELPARERLQTAQAGSGPMARIAIGDQRLQTYLGLLIQSMGISQASHDQRHQPECRLWVVQSGDPMLEEVKQFTSSGPGRRVLILGEPQTCAADEAVVVLPERPLPALLRATLYELAESWLTPPEVIAGRRFEVPV